MQVHVMVCVQENLEILQAAELDALLGAARNQNQESELSKLRVELEEKDTENGQLVKQLAITEAKKSGLQNQESELSKLRAEIARLVLQVASRTHKSMHAVLMRSVQIEEQEKANQASRDDLNTELEMLEVH